MGGRQSVAQSTHGQADLSTSSEISAENIDSQFNPRQICTREHRELRARSLMLSDMVRSETDNSPSMSNVDTGLVMLTSTPSRQVASSSTSGTTPALDRLFRIGSVDLSSTTRSPNRTVFLRPFQFRLCDVKCPVCHKIIPSDDVELHLVVCLTKPKLTYNEDILVDDKGECVICFDDMTPGDIIARLPCLCVYHKTCIDSWFSVKNTCPEHPGDD